VQIDGGFEAQWTDEAGVKRRERLRTRTAAVNHTVRHRFGGLRFHDLRHSYATWLATACRRKWCSG
jgi:integrase